MKDVLMSILAYTLIFIGCFGLCIQECLIANVMGLAALGVAGLIADNYDVPGMRGLEEY